MPCVETKIVINGDSKPIFEIIKNMEAYPSFMHDLVSVEILERGENTTVSHWVSNVDGRKIVWTERDTFYPEEMRITYCQTEGDLKKMMCWIAVLRRGHTLKKGWNQFKKIILRSSQRSAAAE